MSLQPSPSSPSSFNPALLAPPPGLRGRRLPVLRPIEELNSTASFESSRLSSQEQPPSELTVTGQPLTATSWTPLPGPQTTAYESLADITGYGGSAGGGKSMLEIGLAVTQHRKSIIFRRESTSTRDLWSKLTALCGNLGRSNETLLLWRDLPGGREVQLAGCKNEDDWRKFMGNERDLMEFDEATEFAEGQVRTLIAWCRTPIYGQRCRVVLSFNPPSRPEGMWVIDFFGPWLDPKHPFPAEPGELRWYAVIDGKDVARPNGEPFVHDGARGPETIKPLSRTFIPARLEDNPILEATGYRTTLQNVPEPLRSQLLYGDFEIGLTDDEWQTIPTGVVKAAQDRWHKDGGKGHPLAAIGCDVAQGGSDQTALARRYGTWYAEIEVHPGVSVPDANVNASHVLKALTDGGTAYIDADGIGASTYFLVKALMGTAGSSRVQAYLGSDRKSVDGETDASGVLGFYNKRAMAWWRFREKLMAKGSTIALPPERRILAELCAPRYRIVGGQIKLEDKKDVKKRVGFSPDYADAIVMADSSPSFGSMLVDGIAKQYPQHQGGRR